MRILVVDLQSATPVYVQIQDQIRARVGDGSLPPGTPLPPVRQLAADLRLNPNTVAKAYLLLEREGILRTLRRRGTFVADGGPGNARLAADRRFDDALEHTLEEASRLGLRPSDVLDAVRRRLQRGKHGAKPQRPGGRR